MIWPIAEPFTTGLAALLKRTPVEAKVCQASDTCPRLVAESPNDEVVLSRQALGFMGIHDVNVIRAGGSLAVNLRKVRIEDHLAKYESAIATAARS